MTLTADTLDRYRDSLRAERTRILGTISALREEFSHSQSDDTEENGLETHLADNATITFLRERDISIEEHEEHVLAEIDAALGRLAGGTFGTCANCGREIDAQRLDALPWASLCITCAGGS